MQPNLNKLHKLIPKTSHMSVIALSHKYKGNLRVNLIFPICRILFVSYFLLASQVWRVDAVVTHASYGCGYEYDNYTKNSVYEHNLNHLFSNFSSKASVVKFYNLTTGEIPNKVYGLFQCRVDLSLDVCAECIQDATHMIVQDCPLFGEAVVWYYECMLRYANRSIFSLSADSPAYETWDTTNVTDFEHFSHVLADTMDALIKDAALSSNAIHFATREANITLFSQLYTLAECTPDLDELQCKGCLKSALSWMTFGSSTGVRAFLPSCRLMFGVSPFYNVTEQSLAAPSKSNQIRHPDLYTGDRKLKASTIAGIGVAASVGVALTLCVMWLCLKRRKPEVLSNDDEGFEREDNFGKVEVMRYDFATLKAATRDFSIYNKIGEGGFGSVYKGVLENGQEVAIKRLATNSGQGEKEFKNEATVVAKLQHKNLVKLLGFCSHGTEKMLVYEFMPHASLDRFLFDKKCSLSWEIRFNLILGIAKGILYCHEDSRHSIIHRDLKPSNILLDESFNPRISDFGLAKLFGVEQTQGDTKKIIGTYGYMAPEYATAGHFSTKSDVYSFGIIVLEIVSGQKSRFFGCDPQHKEALLLRAWRLWNEGKVLELVDKTLIDKYPMEQVAKCIHIGLLCTQDRPIERPRMAIVVASLNGLFISLPLPKTPNFIGTTVATTNTSYTPYYYDTLVEGNVIEYHPKLDQPHNDDIYTCSEEITELYAR